MMEEEEEEGAGEEGEDQFTHDILRAPPFNLVPRGYPVRIAQYSWGPALERAARRARLLGEGRAADAQLKPRRNFRTAPECPSRGFVAR